MRIRKNAARTVDEIKNPRTSYLICQLNQPPWHDHSFFTQGHWDNDLPINISSSSNDSLPTSDSMPDAVETMDFSFECVSDRDNHNHNHNGGRMMLVDGGIGGGDGDSPGMLLPLSNQVAALVVPNQAAPATNVLPKKRGRPRKLAAPAAPAHNNINSISISNNSNSNIIINSSNNSNSISNGSDNPYEFYYYSGFGPSWSKRRGETKFNFETGNTDISNVDNSNSEEDSIMDDDENKETTGVIKESTSDGDKNDNQVMQSFGSVVSDGDVEEELDYIEDEEDDEEEWYGGRRARKPIKARSLKSLM